MDEIHITVVVRPSAEAVLKGVVACFEKDEFLAFVKLTVFLVIGDNELLELVETTFNDLPLFLRFKEGEVDQARARLFVQARFLSAD